MVLFIIAGALAVASALTVVLLDNPVYCALSLTFNFICLAVLYLSLGAEFLAAIQVIVYAGAIMVLFLFVVTLLNPGAVRTEEQLPRQRLIGPIVALALFAEVVAMVYSRALSGVPALHTAAATGANVTNTRLIGTAIFTTYLFPFEVTSLLLLIAVVGAVVLAKRGV